MIKRIVLAIVAIIVVLGIGAGVYTYTQHKGPFAPTETVMEEVVDTEEVIIEDKGE